MDRIGHEVERSLSRAAGPQGRALTEITSAWPRAVGDAIARNAWPLRIARDGTLQVATTSATWAFELDRMSPEIAERLRLELGENAPKSVRFRVGPVPEPGASAEAPVAATTSAEPADVDPETAAKAAAAASAIEDESLREIVARAARASLRRGPAEGRSDRGFW